MSAGKSGGAGLPSIITSPQSRKIGLLQSFRPGDREAVEHAVKDAKALGVRELRTGVSWAAYETKPGRDWYEWLLPYLAASFQVLPYFCEVPPEKALEPTPGSPPRDAHAYADFLEGFIEAFGAHFAWVELWESPFDRRVWNSQLDPNWRTFCELVSLGAAKASALGKRVVVSAPWPHDPSFLRTLADRGALEHVAAVGLQGFPGTFEEETESWAGPVAAVRETTLRLGLAPEVWITATGYSTWRYDDRRQVKAFLRAIEAPVSRVYWFGARDELQETLPEPHDERWLHFGLKRQDGTPKLLGRLWEAGGIAAVKDAAWVTKPSRGSRREHVLITGGSGFVGTNLAARLMDEGRPVRILDNLSRAGVERNLAWLKSRYDGLLDVEVGDTRDRDAVEAAVEGAKAVFHFAAQVAVTTSLVDPITDFEVNGRGTLNLLEAIRARKGDLPLVFTSTNKVYGALDDVPLVLAGRRYEPESARLKAMGIGEDRPLAFHSPYGCSKGAADQYILDYGHTFGIPTTVFRMSCIYGPHQFGTEDQGWVAHFLIRAMKGEPITLYGDGMQVRDVLFVEDLVRAFLLTLESRDEVAGQAFNIGGGPQNTTSLLELVDLIGELTGRRPAVSFDAWRPADQRYFVSDTSKFRAATGWQPVVGVRSGVQRLFEWLQGPRPHTPSRHPVDPTEEMQA